MKPVRWHDIALEDVERAAAYYREQKDGLDQRFVAAVSAGVALLQRFPALGGPTHVRFRRWIIHGFPYSIVYREHRAFLRIVAVVHHRQPPDIWVGR